MLLKKPSINSFLIFASLFLSSLINYGLVVIVLSFLMMLLVFKLEINKNNLVVLFTLLGYTSISICSLFFYPNGFFHENQLNSAFANYINISFMAVFACLFYQALSRYTTYIFNMLSWVIVAHSLIWITQAILFFLTSFYLDFHGWFVGEPSRYLTQGTIGLLKYRFTGITVEPSTYATTIVLLVLSRLVLSDIVTKNKERVVSKVDIIGLLTAFFTFSTASMFYSIAAILLIYFYRFYDKKHLIFLIAGAVLTGSLLLSVISQNIERFSSVSGIRFSFLNYLFNEREDYLFWFGSNLFALERELYTQVYNLAGEARTMASVNDSGIVPFLMTFTGFSGLVMTLISFYFLLMCSFPLFVSVLIVSLTKISIYHCLFFVFICSSVFAFNKRKSSLCLK
ncbi:hypothetical protein AB4376_04125 [Vibrio breoganii]